MLSLALAAFVVVGHGTSPTIAQAHGLAYPPRLTPDRLIALETAIEQHLGYIPGEVLIKFKAGVTAQSRNRALLAAGSQRRSDDVDWSGSVGLLVDHAHPDSVAFADQLRVQPEIELAEPNYLGQGGVVPNDPDFSSRQWNLQALDLPRTWDITNGGAPNIVVGIIDNGVTTVSQTFSMPIWNGSAITNVPVPVMTNPDMNVSRYVSPQDFVFWSGPVLDLQSHGSHVAGTVAEATNNNLALAGIAYNSSIMPVKVCLGFWDTQFLWSSNGMTGMAPVFSGTTCPTLSVVNGIRYAVDHGANVLNISLIRFPDSAALRDAIFYAVSKGVFVAMSMGNDFTNGNPVNYPSFYAAGIDGAMSVAAVGRSLAHASYSTTGSYCEIAAPGGDGGGSGGIYQMTLNSSDFAPFSLSPHFDNYIEASFQGTSMSSPHVAALAALLMSRGVTSPAAIEKIIKGSAQDLGSPGRDDVFGYGLIQPRAAVFGLGIRR